MNRERLEAARRSIERAERALLRLQGENSFDEGCDHWSQVLVSLKAVYEHLTKPPHSSTLSDAFSAKLVGLRRKEPLLNYVFHARNAEDHGIHQTVAELPPSSVLRIGAAGEDVHIEHFSIDASGNVNLRAKRLPSILHTMTPRHAALRTVRDRGGVTFGVPTSHLGEKLTDRSPESVARRAVAFYRLKVEEAATL